MTEAATRGGILQKPRQISSDRVICAQTLLSSASLASLQKLGGDLRDARRRRRITLRVFAQRLGVSHSTYSPVEAGNPNVRIGIYALALQTFEIEPRFGDVADVRFDAVGLAVDAGRLPQRVRMPKKTPSATPDRSGPMCDCAQSIRP